MSDELKPCLRCGKENPSVYVTFGRDWVVKCVDGCAFAMDGYKTKSAAIRQWNTRPREDALSATIASQATEIERLRDALAPFGRPENAWLTDLPDDKQIVCVSNGTIFLGLTLGNLRAARATLAMDGPK